VKDRDYLAHVQKAIQEIREILAGLDREAYENDVKAQRALERELQIIGDAVHRLSPEFVAQHLDVEWRKIYAARNVVVHHYWGVDQDILWDIVENKFGRSRCQGVGAAAQ
jgi:uncharacterized protein with HEPN domain